MKPDEIDTLFERDAAQSFVEAEVVARAKRSILISLRPVRPLPPVWIVAAWFVLLLAVVAFFGAMSIGFYGLRKLSAVDRAAIFAALGAAGCFAAIASAREMRPAGGRRIGVWVLGIATASMLAIFATLFRDYGMQQFMKQGMPCLFAGLASAVITAAAILLIMRRGFVLNMAAAGLAAGTLAGLAGLSILELHCPNFKAMHVMVWHVGVVVFSGAAGYLAGRFWPRRYSGPKVPDIT